MAVAYPEGMSVSDAERQALDATLGFIELRDSPAWKKITDYMQSLVDEAQDTVDANVSSDSQLAWNLSWRLKQRKAVKIAVEKFVEDNIKIREQVLEDIERMRLGAMINEREESE